MIECLPTSGVKHLENRLISEEPDASGGSQRPLLELAVAAALLLGGIALTPVGSSAFPWLAGMACVLVVGYLGYDAAKEPAAWARWGLLPEGEGSWCVSLIYLGVLGLMSLPIVLLHLFIEKPLLAGHPLTYLVWCTVQDLVFFVLIQRNLEELLDPFVAAALTAVFFGLSHYPYAGLMILTALAGAAWGFLYLTHRALVLITASHWLLGVFILG